MIRPLDGSGRSERGLLFNDSQFHPRILTRSPLRTWLALNPAASMMSAKPWRASHAICTQEKDSRRQAPALSEVGIQAAQPRALPADQDDGLRHHGFSSCSLESRRAAASRTLLEFRFFRGRAGLPT